MAKIQGKRSDVKRASQKRGFATWSIGKKIGAVLGGTLLGVERQDQSFWQVR